MNFSYKGSIVSYAYNLYVGYKGFVGYRVVSNTLILGFAPFISSTLSMNSGLLRFLMSGLGLVPWISSVLFMKVSLFVNVNAFTRG
jgi:hypothetical protein